MSEEQSGVLSRRHLVAGGAATAGLFGLTAFGGLAPRAVAQVGAMRWPVTGYVRSLMGPRNGKEHQGIDVDQTQGSPVRAAYAGRVTHRFQGTGTVGTGYGRYVDITHPNGWVTRYAHLSAHSVSDGAQVTPNQQIGLSGGRAGTSGAGNSQGPHLHFEIRLHGDPYYNLNQAFTQSRNITQNNPIPIDFPGLGAVPAAGYFRGIAGLPGRASSYWLVARDGGVFSFDAPFHGSMGGRALSSPVVGMAAHPSGGGYWLVAADGGIFAFGNAPFRGSMGGRPLNSPVVGMAATPDGNGYWLVAADGGIFAFNAPFRGSMGGQPLNSPVVGMAAYGGGYWLVGADGGIFAFGTPFHGSMGGRPLNSQIVGMASTPAGGYWLVAGDGGIFAFNAPFHGSMGGRPLNRPITGMAGTGSGNGYWLLGGDGGVFAYGDALFVDSGTPYDPD